MIKINNCFCMAAFALLGSSFVMMFFVNTSHMKTFANSLNEKQSDAYKRIVRERAYIYILATVLGLLAGYAFSDTKCKAVSSALFVQTMVYMLWPKSDHILNHIESNEQSRLWVKKYAHMSRLGNVGLVAGIVLYLIIKKN